MTIRITKDMQKSINPEMTALTGMINRGKYTFEIIEDLPTMDWLEALMEFAKNCQGRRPVNIIIEYGTPSEGSLAKPPNITEKMIIVNNG